MYTFSMKFDLPIPMPSRLVADQEGERLRHSVVPIVGATNDLRPYVVGSGVLIDFGCNKVLATAHHVLADNQDAFLQTFDSSGNSRPFGGVFQVDEEADVAVKRLSDEEASAFSHLPFIQAEDLGLPPEDKERFYAGVCGYPATKARTIDRKTIDTRMAIAFGIGRSDGSRAISVHFDKKRGARDGDEHVRPPDPHGMSGGAIFGIKLSGYAIFPGSRGRLVGIGTRWEKASKEIHGASISVVEELAKQIPQP